MSTAAAHAASRRVAAIDLGTNTVRYLLVEIDPASRRWRVIEEDQRVTRLGQGLATTGRLGEDPMSRTGAAVSEYAARARRGGAGDVRVVATSAVREAANGHAFAATLARTAGVEVTVVSGEDEARLTVRGVLAGLPHLTGLVTVFDVGGGSTEFIRWRDGAIAAVASLTLGVVPLAERHPFPGPVAWARYDRLVDEVRERLGRDLPPGIAATPCGTLVGTAGTVTSLAALDLALRTYDATRVQGHRLTRPAIDAQLRRLGALDLPGRAALPCLEPGRADVLLAGVAIVRAVMDRLGADALVVSDWSLREGIVAELADGEGGDA